MGNEAVTDGSFANADPAWIYSGASARTGVVGRTDSSCAFIQSARTFSPFTGTWSESNGQITQGIPLTLSRGVQYSFGFWLRRFTDWQAILRFRVDPGDGNLVTFKSVTVGNLPVIGTWYEQTGADFTSVGSIGSIQFETDTPDDNSNGLLLIDDVSVLRGLQIADIITPENGQYPVPLMQTWPIDDIAGVMRPEDEMAKDDLDGKYRITADLEDTDRGTIQEEWSHPGERDWKEL